MNVEVVPISLDDEERGRLSPFSGLQHHPEQAGSTAEQPRVEGLVSSEDGAGPGRGAAALVPQRRRFLSATQ